MIDSSYVIEVNVAALASSAIQAMPRIGVNAESSGHADAIQAGIFWLTDFDSALPI
jgi:hypothetical protein